MSKVDWGSLALPTCVAWYNCSAAGLLVATGGVMKPRPAQPYWPRVLTDWCAFKAFEAAGCPPCLRGQPELQAALVAEVGDFIRVKALERNEAAAENRMRAAAERVYERLGGEDYCLLRDDARLALGDFSPAIPASEKEELLAHGSGETWMCDYWHSCEQEVTLLRFQLEPEARQARREAAKSYWIEANRRRIPDDFFADCDPMSPPSRLSLISPPWWGLFVTCLQRVVAKTNPSTARLLQELPRLRVEATRPGQKKVYGALVDEWREENAETNGLFQPVHFPMLEHRAFEKWHELTAWYAERAEGDMTDTRRREIIRHALCQHLAGFVCQRSESYWKN